MVFNSSLGRERCVERNLRSSLAENKQVNKPQIETQHRTKSIDQTKQQRKGSYLLNPWAKSTFLMCLHFFKKDVWG